MVFWYHFLVQYLVLFLNAFKLSKLENFKISIPRVQYDSEYFSKHNKLNKKKRMQYTTECCPVLVLKIETTTQNDRKRLEDAKQVINCISLFPELVSFFFFFKKESHK